MKYLKLLVLACLAMPFVSCEKCYDCERDTGFGTTPDTQNFCGEEAEDEAQALEALGWECS